MAYRTRPGIVMTNICGVLLLIPTRKAAESCTGMLKLSLLSSIMWETIEKSMPMEKAFQAFQILTKRSDDEVRAKMREVQESLCEKGFLIEVPDEDDINDES